MPKITPKVLALLFLAAVLVAAIVSVLPERGVRQSLTRDNVGFPGGDASVGKSMPGVAPMPPVFYGEADLAERGMILPPQDGSAAGPPGGDRVIKTADLSMQVDDVADAVERAKAVAAGKEGFVISATISGTEKGQRTGFITLRVPVAKFEETVSELKKVATLLETEHVTGQDVTEEFADLESQIKNAKAEEAQYLEIMKRASDISDILEVSARLAEVRGRIERLEGRRQFLANRTEYSTVNATMREEAVVRVPTTDFRPLQVARESLRFLIAAFQVLVNAVIVTAIVGVGLLGPLFLALWALVYLGRRLAGRYFGKRR